MEKKSVRRLKEAKDKARPELREFGWDRLCLAERLDLSRHGLLDHFERLDGLTFDKKEFTAKFDLGRYPAIFTGLQSGWQAEYKWTFSRLARKYRNQKWKVGEDNSGYSVKLKMKYFQDYLAHTKDDSPLYLFDSSFGERHKTKAVLEDYAVPRLFDDDVFAFASERRRPPHRWFVVGPQRSGTGIHIDPLGTSAWNALVKGYKRWCLFPTDTPKELLKVKRGEGGKHQDEAVTWFSVIYPRTLRPDWPKQWAPLELVQGPGETVYVPGGWWHAVLNLSDTIAVTQNYCSEAALPVVWHKTVRGRPKFAKHWLKALKVAPRPTRRGGEDDGVQKSRPDLAAVCESVDVRKDIGVASDSSSSDSSSSSSSSEDEGSSSESEGSPHNSRASSQGQERKRKTPEDVTRDEKSQDTDRKISRTE